MDANVQNTKESAEQEELNQDFIKQSILLNMDIMDEIQEEQENTNESCSQSEFVGATEHIQGQLIQNVEVSNAVEAQTCRQDFILDIEDKREKSDIYKVRKQIEAYTRRSGTKQKASKDTFQKYFQMELAFEMHPMKESRSKSRQPNTCKSHERIKEQERNRISNEKGFRMNHLSVDSSDNETSKEKDVSVKPIYHPKDRTVPRERISLSLSEVLKSTMWKL